VRALLARAFRGQFLIEAVTRARGLLILPIATRALGPEGYGQIAFAAALTGLVGTIATLGMPAAMSRFLPGKEHDHERAGIFWPGFAASVVSASLLAALTIALFAVAPLEPAGIGLALIVVASVNVISQELKVFLFSFWRFTLELDGYYRFMAVDAAAVGIVQLIVLLPLNGGPVAIIGATVVSDAILLLIALVLLRRRLPWARPTREVLMPLYKFGAPLGATGLLNWANNTADRFFIGAIVSSAALGVYSVGYNLGFIAVSLFATPIFAVLSSIVFRAWDQGDRDGAQRILVRFANILMTGCMPLILSLQFFGQPVINALAGPEFADAHDYVTLVGVGYLLMFMGDLYGYPLWLHARQYLYSFAMVASVAVNIAGNAILVPRFGAIGSAIATTASLGLLAVALVVINLRNGYMHPPLVAPVATAVLSTSVFAAFSLAWPDNAGVPLALAFSAAATLVFLLAAYPLRLLPADPLELLRRRRAPAATVTR
jgi:O-antigen/teichoic acid export membrane protein